METRKATALFILAMGFLAPAPAVAAADTETAIHHGPAAEMFVNGVTLSYRVHGRADGRPMLLISGTGMQLIEWPPELIRGLVARGYRVIVYDNRDAGQSTHFAKAGAPDWPAIFGAMASGKPAPLPYRAGDMAADAIALLDALKIERADLIGVSGGAAIAALVEIDRPERVRALTLLMANSGDPQIPMPADSARLVAISPLAAAQSTEDQIALRIKTHRALAGRAYPVDDARLRKIATAAVTRDADPHGAARQGAAIIALGDLKQRLTTIRAPTVVIHGSDDPLISYRAGQQVAAAISGAKFMLLNGMGHDLPVQLIPTVLEAVDAVAARER